MAEPGRRIHRSTHIAFDYATALVFAVGPTLLQFHGAARWIAYALAIAHLGLIWLTNFSGQSPRPIRLRFHGYVELGVASGLAALVVLAPDVVPPPARSFFAAAGVAILAMGCSSLYLDPGSQGR